MKDMDNPGLSLADIEDLKRKGFNQSEIARMYGVTRQAVSKIKQKYGGSLTPREQVNQSFPWKVSATQQQTSPYRLMRNHGEYIATGGKGMSDDKLRRLRNWYAKLREENVVLEFGPEIPPIEGVSNKGGFAYRERRPEDGDLLIRVNEHTEISDEGKMIWRFPPREP